MEDPQVQAAVSVGQEPPGRPASASPSGEVDVDPAGEQVLGVPGGLPVAEEDQVGHAASVCRRAPGRLPAPGPADHGPVTVVTVGPKLPAPMPVHLASEA